MLGASIEATCLAARIIIAALIAENCEPKRTIGTGCRSVAVLHSDDTTSNPTL